MRLPRPLALHAIVAVALASGCGGKRPPVTAPAVPPTLVVLLADPGTTTAGRARVSNEFGSVNLASVRAGTLATGTAAPGTVTTFSEDEITKLFGEALSALPPAPRHFTLQFRFESDALTPESSALIPSERRR